MMLSAGAHEARALSAVAHFAPDVIEVAPTDSQAVALGLRGGGWFSGLHPFGYRITPLGEKFLAFDDTQKSIIGIFLASMRSTVKFGRKRRSILKGEWLEMVRYAKTADASRVYQRLDEIIDFCLKANLIA
eukprot:CAMPEP_0172625602 /NCGR_PEP_ID=MMETSP1068-20121228/144759_1 /TAXON_ID=35684 /ORGANISM="Pseudopedinella elastica, Strain CCMP716" /LENGTH=130 /DNA_ID=CAMNT_0013434941 /DNA_START=55 /DNA_END=447 /DNA_ORIENTATION=-